MLRPATIDPTNYQMALRPLQGYERRVMVSLSETWEIGTFTIIGLNSGVFTPNAAQVAALSAEPRELAFVLDTPADAGVGGQIVITVNGTDSTTAALSSKTATIAVPAYSSLTRATFPRGYGAEVAVTEGTKWKTVTPGSMTVAAPAACANVRLKLLAIPSYDTFSLIGCRAAVDFTVKVQQPFAIPCGIDMGAYIKPGEITVGSLSISAKILNGAEGLSRINGRRVTGLLRDMKEDTLNVQNTYLGGLIISGNESAPEGAEPAMFQAQGLFEQSCALLAG